MKLTFEEYVRKRITQSHLYTILFLCNTYNKLERYDSPHVYKNCEESIKFICDKYNLDKLDVGDKTCFRYDEETGNVISFDMWEIYHYADIDTLAKQCVDNVTGFEWIHELCMEEYNLLIDKEKEFRSFVYNEVESSMKRMNISIIAMLFNRMTKGEKIEQDNDNLLYYIQNKETGEKEYVDCDYIYDNFNIDYFVNEILTNEKNDDYFIGLLCNFRKKGGSKNISLNLVFFRSDDCVDGKYTDNDIDNEGASNE